MSRNLLVSICFLCAQTAYSTLLPAGEEGPTQTFAWPLDRPHLQGAAATRL